jgi:hypothetical protein
MTLTADHRPASPHILYADLPGPTRKRTHSPYCFRLTYRGPDPWATGCALLWEVHGGRMTYQIAVEREADGGLRWHCTCADAVYRGEDFPDYQCKHVRALRTAKRQACA